MPEVANALPSGFSLHEYRIESVLGAGGFGLTYLATDANLNLKVALKEYLPGDFAARNADNTVEPKSDSARDSFQWGLQRFMDEAKTLASFRHPHIVRVMRFFEANHTGYMVMEFVEGQPLPEWIAARRPLARGVLLGLAAPLLDGLEVIHRAGYLHRDIKPANVFMRSDGSPVLLDFGSARELKGGNQELTAVVSPGYAPLEQYHAHGKQGPWSDLYAFGGVLYWMVTGSKPVEAAARVRHDVMPSAVEKGNRDLYGQEVLAAIDWALKPNEDERPQSVTDFRRMLIGGVAPAAADERTVPMGSAPTVLVAKPQAPTSIPTKTAMSGLTGMALDREILKKVEAELMKHIGPIAPVVIRKAAKSSSTMEILCNTVGQEIADEQTRAAFIKKFMAGEKSGQPVSGRTALADAPSEAAVQSISRKFTPEMIARAEKLLSQHIGAVAKVVVKRAAAKARDEAELYLLISDEIKDPAEKKMFAKKAISISSRK